jgi:hypothetical protein
MHGGLKEDCMPELQQPKQSGPKGPRLNHDTETPAYRIIYGLFASLSDFCDKTDTPLATAHLWLKNGLVPAHRQAKVITKAREAGVDIEPALFVPVPKAA